MVTFMWLCEEEARSRAHPLIVLVYDLCRLVPLLCGELSIVLYCVTSVVASVVAVRCACV